jgi:hypothetical protein
LSNLNESHFSKIKKKENKKERKQKKKRQNGKNQEKENLKMRKVGFTNLVWQHCFLHKNFYNARKSKENTEQQNS